MKIYGLGFAISPNETGFGPLFYSGKLDKGIKIAHKYGFDVIELSIRTIKDIDPIAVNELLLKNELRISALATGQACLFDSLCLAAEDDETRLKTVAHFNEIVKLAVLVRASAVIIGGIRGRLPGDPSKRDVQYRKSIDALRKCAEYADERNITLLVEPINRYETNWIHTTADGLKVLNEVEMDSAKLLLDTFHMNIEEPNTLDAFRIAGDRLGYVHFADNNRLTPGQGQTNFNAILDVLDVMQYSGPIVVEALPLPDNETAVRNIQLFWRNML